MQQGDVSTAARVAHSTKGWFRWAQRFSGWRVEIPIWKDSTVVPGWEPSGTPGATRGYWGLNAGVSGQTVSDVVARLEEVAAIPADEYHIEGVTNSMGGPLTPQEILDLVLEGARFLTTETGRKVRIYTVLARDTTAWPNPSTQRTNALEYNRLLRSQNEFEVVDFNKGFLDYTQDINVPRPENTNDGTHISGVGASRMGREIAKAWAQEYPPVDEFIKKPTDNFITDGFLQGTGGSTGTATTGDVSDGMTVERSSGDSTAVASVVAGEVAGTRGDAQKLVVTPSGAAGESVFFFRTAPSDTAHNVPGKYVQGSVKIRINSANDSIGGVVLKLDDQGTGGVNAEDFFDEGQGFMLDSTDSFVEFRTPALLLVPDSTEVRVRVEIIIDGQGTGDADIDIAELGFIEVEDPEIEFNTVAPGSRQVAIGKTVTSIRGILSEGALVSPTDFGGGAASVLDLERKGLLVKL